jgi:hypothetical protein
MQPFHFSQISKRKNKEGFLSFTAKRTRKCNCGKKFELNLKQCHTASSFGAAPAPGNTFDATSTTLNFLRGNSFFRAQKLKKGLMWRCA